MSGRWRQRRLLLPGILIGILLLIALLSAISATRQSTTGAPPAYPDYNVHSSAPDGTRALALWLRDLGYTPRTLEYEPFRLRAGDGLLFMLFPTLDANDAQIAEIDAWVRNGGTLVLASGEPTALLQHFGLAVAAGSPQPTDVRPLQPLLLDPAPEPTTINRYGELLLLDPGWVPLLGDAGHVVA